MAATLKTEVVQNPSSATVNLTLDASGGVAAGQNLSVTGTTTLTGAVTLSTNATSSGTFVMSSPYTMRNKIINGAMVIDQRNAGAAVTATTANPFTLDRWQSVSSVSSKYTVQQNAGSVTPPVGFINYLGVTSSSAYAITSSDQFRVFQSIEGLNIADLSWGTASAKTVTLSFVVYSSLTGTFGGSLANNGYARSYPFSYTIPAANTWTTISVTIPGDTTGTWLTTNGNGIIVSFGFGVGSTLSGTAGAWASAAYVSSTGATSVVGTNGATFYITGVQLERGTVATPFEYRNYQQELAMCQRYCFKMSTTGNYGPYGMGHGINTTAFRTIIKTAQTMRAQPTLSFTTASGFQWSFGNVLSAIAAADYGLDAFSIDCTSTGIAANGGYLLTSANNTTSSITATAEL